jgi:hypothetical protein
MYSFFAIEYFEDFVYSDGRKYHYLKEHNDQIESLGFKLYPYVTYCDHVFVYWGIVTKPVPSQESEWSIHDHSLSWLGTGLVTIP